MTEKLITKEYLKEHPDHIFVFGDNGTRSGLGGAAVLRDMPNTYGFITKREPNSSDWAFYKPEEYFAVYKREISNLAFQINRHPKKRYLISKLGAGLANKYKIFEKVIEPSIKKDIGHFDNVEFLW